MEIMIGLIFTFQLLIFYFLILLNNRFRYMKLWLEEDLLRKIESIGKENSKGIRGKLSSIENRLYRDLYKDPLK